VPLLVKLGICELAAGVLSGWAMVAMVERPEALKRLGVRQLSRIRQTHLDLLMQGTILAAVGAAVTSVPTWIGVLLVFGAYVAPLTLGVLAFRPELQKGSIAYRGTNTVVLAGFTVAWVALAITVLSR
jgi:hydroxylaminobenzene mutase